MQLHVQPSTRNVQAGDEAEQDDADADVDDGDDDDDVDDDDVDDDDDDVDDEDDDDDDDDVDDAEDDDDDEDDGLDDDVYNPRHDTVISCTCPHYQYQKRACKHMFLLARWHGQLNVQGNLGPQAISFTPLPIPDIRPPVDDSPNTATPATQSVDTSDPSSPTTSSPALPSSSSRSSQSQIRGVNASLEENPRDKIKAQLRKLMRTMEQSHIPPNQDSFLSDIAIQLEEWDRRLQQATVLSPNRNFTRQRRSKRQ